MFSVRYVSSSRLVALSSTSLGFLGKSREWIPTTNQKADTAQRSGLTKFPPLVVNPKNPRRAFRVKSHEWDFWDATPDRDPSFSFNPTEHQSQVFASLMRVLQNLQSKFALCFLMWQKIFNRLVDSSSLFLLTFLDHFVHLLDLHFHHRLLLLHHQHNFRCLWLLSVVALPHNWQAWGDWTSRMDAWTTFCI